MEASDSYGATDDVRIDQKMIKVADPQFIAVNFFIALGGTLAHCLRTLQRK